MKLRPNLATFPLDDDLVIFSEEAQHLVGLNSSAALVFRKLQEGAQASEIADSLVSQGVVAPDEAVRWVATTLDSLGSHAMLANGVTETVIPNETVYTDPNLMRQLAEMPPYAPFTPAAELHYRLLDTRLLIRFADVRQVPWVNAVIGHLVTYDASVPSVLIDIQAVTTDDDRLRSEVYRDGEPVGYAPRLRRLGPLVKGALWQSAVNAHNFLFYIHAGVVGTGETCVVMPAPPGSGKSSLTAALTHKGFGYFSDEVALVEPGTFHVAPMPLAMCVKREGWDLIANYYPELLTALTHRRDDGKVVRYLPPPVDAMQQKSVRVSHIIFPRYRQDGPTEIARIARSEALRRLMDECLALRLRLDATKVAELVRWIAGIDCYELKFSSLDAAVELVSQVTKAPQVTLPP